MKAILVGGRAVFISDRDLRKVSLLRLRIGWKGYVFSGKRRLHRIILDAPAGVQVDHLNGNKLDNRRSNLRLCNQSQNSANRRGWGRSGTKGVFQHGKKWKAAIRVDGSYIHLGVFASKGAASRAYNDAAREHFGEHARINR